MIRRKVDAVLLLRDGFTGRVVARDVLCRVDGQPLRRPLWKQDGYLVLHDLAPGPHRVTLTRPGFCPACLMVEAGPRLSGKDHHPAARRGLSLPGGDGGSDHPGAGLPDGPAGLGGDGKRPRPQAGPGQRDAPRFGGASCSARGWSVCCRCRGPSWWRTPTGRNWCPCGLCAAASGNWNSPWRCPTAAGWSWWGRSPLPWTAAWSGCGSAREASCGCSAAAAWPGPQIREGSQEFIWRPEGER